MIDIEFAHPLYWGGGYNTIIGSTRGLIASTTGYDLSMHGQVKVGGFNGSDCIYLHEQYAATTYSGIWIDIGTEWTKSS